MVVEKLQSSAILNISRVIKMELETVRYCCICGNPLNKILKHICPTGASKILFALRPNCLIPWDDPIREEFGYHNFPHSSSSYIDYLEYSCSIFSKLCARYGFELKDLPQKIDRPKSTFSAVIFSGKIEVTKAPFFPWYNGVLPLLFYHKEGCFCC
jgi:hypothetical protein